MYIFTLNLEKIYEFIHMFTGAYLDSENGCSEKGFSTIKNLMKSFIFVKLHKC